MTILFWYFIERFFTSNEGKIHVIKELIAYIYVVYLKRKIKKRFDFYNYDDENNLEIVGFKIPQEEWTFECPQKNLNYSESIDSIQFYGVNSKNESLFVRISKISPNLASIWLQLGLTQNKTYTLPVEKEWKVSRAGEDCFAAGGLRIRCLAPMRKWRISYNGILAETRGNTSENVHVKFSFIWIAASEILDLSTDIDPLIFANFLAKQRWRCSGPPSLQGITKYLDSYEQAGNIIGTVSTKSENEQEVYLWGCKKRSVEIQDTQTPICATDFFGFLKDGESFHAAQIKFPHLLSGFSYGYLLHSNGIYFTFQDCAISIPQQDVLTVPNAEIIFHERNQEQKIRFGFPTKTMESRNQEDPRNTTLILHVSPVLYNDELGHGVITNVHNRPTDMKIVSSEAFSSSKRAPLTQNLLVVSIKSLGDDDCQLAGGKAASLGRLTTISHKNKDFFVPKGLVLTTSAYTEFLNNRITVRKSISHLEDTASGKIIDNLQDACANTVKAITKESLPPRIRQDLKTTLENIFPRSHNSLKFAVRSSATGEDSEELSAAGQMETLLGICGFEEIMKAIVDCWASQFSYTAIQYKRQNGQILNSPMAVVVQEMVPADSAGVIFTCDPVSGNPELIVITANYGIGESVVSANADPDTIVMMRDITGKIRLHNVQIGQKKTKVVMQEFGNGTEEQEVNVVDAESCCIPESLMTSLAELAVKIEDDYACPMDIEWAVIKDKIYLLQARPVTTFDKETDFEIIHENNCFMQSEGEYTTIANVGEVFPGAFSTLGMSVMFKMWDVLINRVLRKRNPNMKFCNAYGWRMLTFIGQRCHFNILEGILRFHTSEESFVSNSNVISIFGRLIEDKEMYRLALKRSSNYPNTWRSSAVIQFYHVVKSMLTVETKLKIAEPHCKNYEIYLNHCRDAQAMHDEILKHMNQFLSPIIVIHLDGTTSSSLWNSIILYILRSASKGWTNDVFSDFSTLLSSISNVESADVPDAIRRLSNSIASHINPSEFKAMTTEDALTWLMESEVGEELEEFLTTHGHRCLKELDIYSKPWGINQLPLVKTLQGSAGKVIVQAKEATTTQKLLLEVRTPLSFIEKLILGFFVPFARKGVRLRERTKSIFIRVMHIARTAYLKLARQMVLEGRIPDEDILFFLTVDELEQLLKTRSPRLIQKAIRRKAAQPKLEKYVFPEISRGYPKPINIDDESEFVERDDATLSIKGVPVSRGIAKGPARVVTTLEEAQHIQQGEILIAHSTDIGWTPYFPLLAGVTTELGGLISHGAVVAREYGLPCVVAVHNATRKFKTGDIVLLDGNVGVLQLLK